MSNPRSSECSAILVSEVNIINTQLSTQLAWLKLNEKFQSGSSSSSGSANLKFLDVFSGGGSSSSDSAKVQKKLEKHKFSYSTEESFNLLSVGLGSDQVDAWVECIKNKDFHGPLLIPVMNDPKYPVVKFIYNSPRGAGNSTISIETIVKGCKIEGDFSDLDGSGERDWHITRDEIDGVLQDAIITVTAKVNGGSLSDTMSFPYYSYVPTDDDAPDERVGDWVYINPRSKGLRTIGHVSSHETGRLIAEGQFTVWRKRKWLNPDWRSALRVRFHKNGKQHGNDVDYASGGVIVPPGCDVDVYFSDTKYGDNATHPTNPLRVRVEATS